MKTDIPGGTSSDPGSSMALRVYVCVCASGVQPGSWFNTICPMRAFVGKR